MSLRGENGSERRGNPSSLEGDGRVCLFVYWPQWIATGLRPRDDKVSKEWQCAVRLYHDLCHCEERTQVTDAAIHRVSRKANGFVYSLTGSQWIATGLRPRDDKVSKEWQCAVRLYHDLCHCEEKA
ncbi:hypothetical protein OAV71_05615 [Opitutales bacterium]|nr:hypothetical protein [Opitutales bacterium]